MIRPGTVRRVAFDTGTASATAPLTWAQQHMLSLIEVMEPVTQSLNIGFPLDLRAGLTPERVLDALRHTVETFAALRTVYVPPPDGPAQRVRGSGELAVEVVPAPADASGAVAADMARSLAARPFAIAEELPVRVALVTVDGQPRHLAFALSHLAVDFTGSTWLVRYLRTVLARPRLAGTEPVHQPLDEVAWEASPAGRRRGERAVAHHAGTYQAMPQTMLARPTGTGEPPRYRYLQFDSPALAMASAALAGRHNVSPTAVLYAGVCAVSGYAGGLDRAFLQLTVGNRVTRTRFAVGMFTEDVPAYLDLADAGLAEVIARAGAAVPQAVLFGQYPPAELAARRREIELARGMSLDLSCWLNDRRGRARTGGTGDPPSARALAEASARTAWRWIDGADSSTCSYFIWADDVGDAVRLTLIVDSALLPPDEAVGWLRAVEQVLTRAVTGEIAVADIGTHTGLRPFPRGAGWHRTDHTWAHLPTVAELVRTVAGTPRADVYPVPGPDGTRLVAYLSAAEVRTDPVRLHRDVVAALPGRRTAVAPHRYVFCAGPPTEAAIEAWQRVPVLTDGDGRPAATG